MRSHRGGIVAEGEGFTTVEGEIRSTGGGHSDIGLAAGDEVGSGNLENFREELADVVAGEAIAPPQVKQFPRLIEEEKQTLGGGGGTDGHPDFVGEEAQGFAAAELAQKGLEETFRLGGRHAKHHRHPGNGGGGVAIANPPLGQHFMLAVEVDRANGGGFVVGGMLAVKDEFARGEKQRNLTGGAEFGDPIAGGDVDGVGAFGLGLAVVGAGEGGEVQHRIGADLVKVGREGGAIREVEGRDRGVGVLNAGAVGGSVEFPIRRGDRCYVPP